MTTFVGQQSITNRGERRFGVGMERQPSDSRDLRQTYVHFRDIAQLIRADCAFLWRS
jgi:hypothetical protein